MFFDVRNVCHMFFGFFTKNIKKHVKNIKMLENKNIAHAYHSITIINMKTAEEHILAIYGTVFRSLDSMYNM